MTITLNTLIGAVDTKGEFESPCLKRVIMTVIMAYHICKYVPICMAVHEKLRRISLAFSVRIAGIFFRLLNPSECNPSTQYRILLALEL